MSILQPLVSILIPVYNSETYISDTIESCINQLYKNIEVIVVDDGSTDDTLQICKSFSERNKNIHVYSQKNSGAPRARNFAFSKAKGVYIQYLDGDDILSKEKIKHQVELLKGEPYDTISFTNFMRFSNKPKSVINNISPRVDDYHNRIKFYNELLTNGWLQTSCWLTHRDMISKVGDWDESLTRNQDGNFFGRVIFHSKKGFFSKKGGVYYRIENPNSITSKPKNVLYYESYLKSYYYCADQIIIHGKVEDKYRIARVMNSLCERLIEYNSPELDIARKKIAKLGFTETGKLESPFVRNFKYLLGYDNTVILKFKVLKIRKIIKKMILSK